MHICIISGANRNYMQNTWGEKDFFMLNFRGQIRPKAINPCTFWTKIRICRTFNSIKYTKSERYYYHAFLIASISVLSAQQHIPLQGVWTGGKVKL